MLERLLTAYPVLRHPLQHLVYQVSALFYVFLRVVLVGQDLTEVAARRVVELVHQVNCVCCDLATDSLQRLLCR